MTHATQTHTFTIDERLTIEISLAQLATELHSIATAIHATRQLIATDDELVQHLHNVSGRLVTTVNNSINKLYEELGI